MLMLVNIDKKNDDTFSRWVECSNVPKCSLFIFKRWDWNVNAPIRMSHYVGPTPTVVSWHEQYTAVGKNNDILSLPHKNLFHNWKHFLVPDGFSVHTITLHGRLCLVQWERISMTLTKGTGFNLTGLGKHLVPDKNTYLDIFGIIQWGCLILLGGWD